MTAKTLLIAGILAFAPAAVFAKGCIHGYDTQANSCGEGTAWDAELQTCVPSINS